MKKPLLRAGIFVVAIPTGATGAWGLFAPRSFFRSFPRGAAHPWISSLGPYDEHLVRDVGALLLALAVLLLIAGILLDRRLVIAAAVSSLVFNVPHLVFHALHRGDLSAVDDALNLALLGGTVLIMSAVGIGAWRDSVDAP
jgi:hypothetical protein